MSLLPDLTHTSPNATLYKPVFQASTGGGDIVVSSITVGAGQTLPGISPTGIFFNTSDTTLNIPNSNQPSLIGTQWFTTDFTTNYVSTSGLAVCQLGDFGPPLGNYNANADLLVGRLFLGAGSNDGTGLNPFFSGQKPYLTARSNAFNQPSTTVVCSANFAANSAELSTIVGPYNGTLTVSGVNTAVGGFTSSPVISLQATGVFVNPPVPSSFNTCWLNVGDGGYCADISMGTTGQGEILMASPLIEIGSPDLNSCMIAQVYEGFTKIYNSFGVQMGMSTSTEELQITHLNVNINSNLNVSTINSEQPAYASYFSTLFGLNPSLTKFPPFV